MKPLRPPAEHREELPADLRRLTGPKLYAFLWRAAEEGNRHEAVRLWREKRRRGMWVPNELYGRLKETCGIKR